MDVCDETAALIALLRSARQSWSVYMDAITKSGSARTILQDEQGLLAEQALGEARAELGDWERRGMKVLSVFDERYPPNLKAASGAPPLLFAVGELLDRDTRSIAVVGTRKPSHRGRHLARGVTRRLVEAGFTVVSGLAAGIDTVAHQTALQLQGRTVAVIGTGLDHVYPRENAGLQRQIADNGAVVSPFWPETRPSRRTFPVRNGVTAGLTLASVIVEAGAMSGTRILARLAVGDGRPVLLHDALLEQPWARDLAERPGVRVFTSPGRIDEQIEPLLGEALVA